MISIIESSHPDPDWNNRLLNSKLGQIYQTKEYGFSERLFHREPLFLKFISSDGSIVGQLLIILYPQSINNKYLKFFLKTFSHKNNIFARWVYGPVIFNLKFKDEIIIKLQQYLISKNYTIWGSDNPLQLTIGQMRNSFTSVEWGTFLIDLKLSKEILWKNLEKHSARKNIERCMKKNVTIKQMARSDMPLFYELFMSKSENHAPEISISFFENQWDILQPIGYTGFIAYQEEIPIGAIRVSSFNGYVNEFNIIRTEKDTREKLYSQDLLKWHIIKWAIENNFSFYDLTGVNPNPDNSKEKGIFRYKQKWGGKFVKFNVIKN